MTMASERLIKAVAVTAELTGTQLSPAAARVMVEDLALYPEGQVLSALNRCRRELKGRLTIAEVMTRLEDGRPGPEEAWAMIPRDEASSAFWTSEMREAYAAAAPLIGEGDKMARMAFLERYRVLVQQARDARQPLQWEFTPGTDKNGRELVILDAAQKGRISVEAAHRMLPHHRGEGPDEGVNARLLAIANGAFKRLTA